MKDGMCMADGGEMKEDSADGDHEIMMDQVAMEMMDAIEKKDKEAFIECLHTLIADLLMKMEG